MKNLEHSRNQEIEVQIKGRVSSRKDVVEYLCPGVVWITEEKGYFVEVFEGRPLLRSIYFDGDLTVFGEDLNGRTHQFKIGGHTLDRRIRLWNGEECVEPIIKPQCADIIN